MHNTGFRYNHSPATFGVEPDPRSAPEALARVAVSRRLYQANFVLRGLQSLEDARRNNDYVEADVVIEQLQRRLDVVRARAKSGSTSVHGQLNSK